MKRVLPPVYLFAAAVMMAVLHRFVPAVQLVQAPYRYLGIALMLGAFATIAWAAMVFRRMETTIKPFEQSSALIVAGPYRVTRNPIYVSMAAGLLGLAVFFGSLTPFLVVPVFIYLINRRFIIAEEAMLEQTFGAEYSAYKARVGRWV